MSYTPEASDTPKYSHIFSRPSILSSVDNKSPCVKIKIGFSAAVTMDAQALVHPFKYLFYMNVLIFALLHK